jgi:DnaK suppressor protein
MTHSEIRRELVTRVREVLTRYRGTIERADEEHEDQKIEELERAADSWNAHVLAQLGHIDLQELRRLTDAIEKIDSGTYGFCDECGGPIEPARLRALPTTSTCLDCAFDEDQRAYAQERV